MTRRARRRGVGIVHVPKSAGTSTRSALLDAGVLAWSEQYHDPYLDGHAEVVVRGPGWSPVTYSIEELSDALDRDGVVMGHLTLRSFTEAGVDRCWVLVREPRSRLVSRYEHALARPDEVSRFGPGSSIGAFLASPAFLDENEGLVARMLLPSMTPLDVVLEPDPSSFRRTVRRELRSVRRRLAGVVWSEEIDTAVPRLLADVGAPADAMVVGAFPHQGQSSITGEERIMTKEAVARLEELTWRTTIVLEELMRVGLLAPRSRTELDAEFHRTLVTHGFVTA